MLYRITYRLLWLIVRALLALLGGLRVEGAKNVPKHGPLIVMPNHFSDSDPVVLGAAMPRYAYYMAKSELFTIPLLGPLIRFLRGFPVRRGAPDRTALRYAEQRLESGEAVVIFPEGQLSQTGRLQPLHPGIVLIAVRSGAPVLPVALIGSNRLLPYGKLIPRHAGQRLIVRFGRPIPIEELTGGLTGRAALEHGVDYLTRALKGLLGEAVDDAPTEVSSRPAADDLTTCPAE